jgi:Amt family ammonium transporter
VWSADGWIFNGEGPLNGVPAIDFAGGTAVHINAGAAALALVLVLGKRLGWPKTQMRPHNLPLVMLGAGLLWFGWFGFNAGSALAADNTASVVFVNTFAATCAATIGWLITEKIRDGHATSLGAASGMVAGLVAITPAGSAVSPLGALALGLIAGILCALAVGLKFKFGYDDSLDVVGVHLVGGLVGTLLIGFLATEAAPAGVNGLFYGGGTSQLWSQTVAAVVVMAFSFVVALLIALAIRSTMGFRIDEDDEVAGIDQTTHAEVAYELGNSGGGGGKFAGVGSSSVRSQEEVKA